MSCTIFYKGTLKDPYNPTDVLDVVKNHLEIIQAKVGEDDNPIVINFFDGMSESLVFHFEKNRVDDFCKWNGESEEEFYAIFDMFIELKPLFKSLKIDDDGGLWHEYIIQKQPCKIKLRPLSSPNEIELLKRIKLNERTTPSDIEQFIMTESEFSPFHKTLLRIIVEDFIKITTITNVCDFNPQEIIALIKEIDFFGGTGHCEDLEWFDSLFFRIILILWIGNTFEYKKLGAVKNVPNETQGFMTNKEAALSGIESIFLNCHTGGATNAKEAEMMKLAKKHYRTGAIGEVMVIDEPERELEFLFSMMDYLGLKYIGVDRSKPTAQN